MAVLAPLGILDVKGYAIWCGSLLLESWLVVSMALFAACHAESGVVTVLASSLGFFIPYRV